MPVRPRWHHALALVAALAVALLVSERGTGFTVDEGSYAIQAHALRAGSWEIDWPFRALDPDGDHFPYHGGSVTDDAEFAYVAHPAWPAVLSVVTRGVPESVGLRLLPMAGVVAAALAAGALAARLGGGAAWPWGFWVAAASPLLPDGLMTWAHAPAAALAGWALVAALALLQPGARWWWALVLAGTIAGGVLLRSESVLLAGALGVGLLAWTVLRRDRRAVVVGVVVGASGALALLAERAWVSAIAGSASSLTSRDDGGSWLAGRIDGFGSSVLDGSLSSGAAGLCSLVAMALVVLALLSVAGRAPDLPAPALLWAAVALSAVRIVAWPDDPILGLLTAFPAVVVAGLAWRGGTEREALVAGVVVVFALAVLLTQYDDGGGLQWGGRYLAPALVPLAALTATAIVRHLDVDLRRPIAGLLVVAALGGLWITDQVRRDNAAGIDAVSSVGAETVLVAGTQLARLDWAAWPERCWVSGEPGDPAGALEVLAAAGPGHSAYLGYAAATLREAGVVAEPVFEGSPVGRLGDAARPRRCP